MPFGTAAAPSASASSAHRASWKLRRASTTGTARPIPTRTSPRSSAAAAAATRSPSANSSSSTAARDQRARERLDRGDQRRRRLVAQRRPQRGLDRRAASAARRRRAASTIAATRSESPNGASRRARSVPLSSPLTIASSTSPASRRSVSPATRARSSSSATIVTAWCRVSRSKSDSGPASLIATSHASGARPGPPPDPAAARRRGDRQRQPLVAVDQRGHERPRLAPAGALAHLAPAAPASASGSSGRRNACCWSGSPRASNTTTAAPISVASAPTSASSPRSDRTIRSSRSCAARARRSTAYCSLTSWVNAASVIAMNGTSYGTSNTGNSRSAATSSSGSGTAACLKPVPNPSPAS